MSNPDISKNHLMLVASQDLPGSPNEGDNPELKTSMADSINRLHDSAYELFNYAETDSFDGWACSRNGGEVYFTQGNFQQDNVNSSSQVVISEATLRDQPVSDSSDALVIRYSRQTPTQTGSRIVTQEYVLPHKFGQTRFAATRTDSVVYYAKYLGKGPGAVDHDKTYKAIMLKTADQMEEVAPLIDGILANKVEQTSEAAVTKRRKGRISRAIAAVLHRSPTSPS